MTIGMVGTYPPTRCGIATFTHSLESALERIPGTSTRIVRIIDREEGDGLSPARSSGRNLPQPSSPQHLVNGDPGSRDRAARRLNDECDAVIVQHEFGIYGGPDGSEVLTFLSQLDVPVILVLHTVLDEPTDRQRAIIDRATSMAHHVVVMSENAESVLLSRYAVDPHRVRRIPHGVFSVPRATDERRSDGVFTMLTWGLLGPGKGIEWVIMALALLHPAAADVRYHVVGQTHPKVLSRDGEAYRLMLMRLSDDLGVTDRVSFVDEYLSRGELSSQIAGADVVVLPYDSRVQATSGVLVEALSARVPVIATQFPYAREMIPHGQGWLVPHQDPRALADAIERAKAAARGSARLPWPSRFRGASTDWSDVARMYRRLVDRVIASRSA